MSFSPGSGVSSHPTISVPLSKSSDKSEPEERHKKIFHSKTCNLQSICSQNVFGDAARRTHPTCQTQLLKITNAQKKRIMRMHLYRILPAYVFPTTSADRPRIIIVQNKVSNVKEQREFCMIDYCREEGPMRKLYAPRRKSSPLIHRATPCRYAQPSWAT